jgi:uncharacterized membrane protein
MILYHFFFDIDFLIVESIDFSVGFWFWFARVIAFSFILLVGVSLSLHSFRKGMNSLHERLMQIKRGLFVLGLGFGITLVTGLLFPSQTIWFGILHFIGLGVILCTPFVRKPKWSLVTGLGIFLLGTVFYSSLLSLDIFVLFPFSFTTFDYFPLFPWLGAMLMGIFLGHFFYPAGKRNFSLSIETKSFIQPLSWIGKRSLLIYLIHQPILVLIISTVTGKWFF